MCTVDWNAWGTWVGALSTAAIAVLTLLTLLKVREYTTETRNLRLLGQDQVEAQMKPVLVATHVGSSIRIINIGLGPALNVRFTETTGRMAQQSRFVSYLVPEGWQEAGEMGDLEFSQIFDSKGEGVTHHRFAVTYESVAGVIYESVAQWSAETVYRHIELRIRRVSQSSPSI